MTDARGESPTTLSNDGSGGVPAASVEPVELAQAIASPPDDPLEQLRYSERQLLMKLVKQVRQLSPSEQLFFVWLIENDEQSVTSHELADAVSIDRDATRRSRTDRLLNLPFIRRTGTQRFVFKATFGDYCRKYFKTVADTQVLVEHLAQAAQSR